MSKPLLLRRFLSFAEHQCSSYQRSLHYLHCFRAMLTMAFFSRHSCRGHDAAFWHMLWEFLRFAFARSPLDASAVNIDPFAVGGSVGWHRTGLCMLGQYFHTSTLVAVTPTARWLPYIDLAWGHHSFCYMLYDFLIALSDMIPFAMVGTRQPRAGVR